MVSDWGAVSDRVAGLAAGLDLEMPSSGGYNDRKIVEAVRAGKLDERLLRDFAENANRDFINALDALLPQKMIPAAVKLSGIPERTKVNAVTRQQRLAFRDLLKHFPIRLLRPRGVEEAIVTAGGVDVKEVAPRTMESKLCRGLYFAGEVLDLDARTGGYNLQIAWSTGHLLGNSVPLEDSDG